MESREQAAQMEQQKQPKAPCADLGGARLASAPGSRMKCLGRNGGSLEARLPGDDAGKAVFVGFWTVGN